MATLTDEQAKLFLDPNYAVAATIRKDGSLNQTVVWVDWDGENVLFNTAEGRAKPRNIRHNPNVSVHVRNPDDPYQWITVSGKAEMTEEGAEEHIHKLAKKYQGKERYDLRPGERRLLIRIPLERVNAYGF
jgi:PPOX class probable F420-dependent enzyme